MCPMLPHRAGRTGPPGGQEVSRWADGVKTKKHKLKIYTRYIWAAVTQISRATISSQSAPAIGYPIFPQVRVNMGNTEFYIIKYFISIFMVMFSLV